MPSGLIARKILREIFIDKILSCGHLAGTITRPMNWSLKAFPLYLPPPAPDSPNIKRKSKNRERHEALSPRVIHTVELLHKKASINAT